MWSGLVPFFHEEVLAFKLKLWVGVAWGGLRIEVAKEVLGGDWEGFKPIGAQEEQHRVGQSVKGEVSPILRGPCRLDPWEGQTTARVCRA